MSDRFEGNPTAMYLEAMANALKAGDMKAVADILEKLTTFDPEAAEAVVATIKTLSEIARHPPATSDGFQCVDNPLLAEAANQESDNGFTQ